MEQSNKIERSEVWNNIYEVLALLGLKESTGDAMDRPSAATEIEALFFKLLALQNVSDAVFCSAPEHIKPCRHEFSGICQYNGHCNFKKTER